MRILIADPQPKVRFALRVALERQPGLKTISEAFDAADLLAQASVICPDLVLVDWELLEMPIAQLISALHDKCSNTHVIILGCRAETHEAAIAAGADAFVCKCDAPERLLSTIARCVKAQEPMVGQEG